MCHIAGDLLTKLHPRQACLPRAADGTPISSQVVRLMLSALPPPMPAPTGLLLPPHHCSPSLAEVVWRLVAPPYAVGVPLRLPPHISPADLQREITMKQICVWHRLSPITAAPQSWTTGILRALVWLPPHDSLQGYSTGFWCMLDGPASNLRLYL